MSWWSSILPLLSRERFHTMCSLQRKELSMCLLFLFVKLVKIDLSYLKMRKHSSGMCTAPCWPWCVCVCPGGVRGCVSRQVCILGGGCCRQVCPGVYTHPGQRHKPPQTQRHTTHQPQSRQPSPPPPPDRQKPVKTLPCPELRLRAVIKTKRPLPESAPALVGLKKSRNWRPGECIMLNTVLWCSWHWRDFRLKVNITVTTQYSQGSAA